MRQIVYRREYDMTIVETYNVEVPEHLLSDDSSDGMNALDVYVTSDFGPDHVDRLGMVEDSLFQHVTVLGDVAES